jgi:serine/threonine protein kinase
MLLEIALGLKYIIDKHVTHNDIKPANILVSKNYVTRIIDFGESSHADAWNPNPGRTMPYASPDMF